MNRDDDVNRRRQQHKGLCSSFVLMQFNSWKLGFSLEVTSYLLGMPREQLDHRQDGGSRTGVFEKESF